jgi:hypothetical protein
MVLCRLLVLSVLTENMLANTFPETTSWNRAHYSLANSSNWIYSVKVFYIGICNIRNMPKQPQTLIEHDLLTFNCFRISQNLSQKQWTFIELYNTTVWGIVQTSRVQRSAILLDYFIAAAQIFKFDDLLNMDRFTPAECCYFPNALCTCGFHSSHFTCLLLSYLTETNVRTAGLRAEFWTYRIQSSDSDHNTRCNVMQLLMYDDHHVSTVKDWE